jgi:hypothetical protein
VPLSIFLRCCGCVAGILAWEMMLSADVCDSRTSATIVAGEAHDLEMVAWEVLAAHHVLDVSSSMHRIIVITAMRTIVAKMPTTITK